MLMRSSFLNCGSMAHVSLWRRTREEVEASMPPGLEIVRCERVRGYEVLELGFVTSYWVVEAFKP